MAITVIETWYLNDEAAGQATTVMQRMDDALGDNAHAHPGWNGHATFLQDDADPHLVTWQYSWRSKEDHQDLLASEESLAEPLYRKYCTRPRHIRYATELEVEVEHDH
ncbi:hypothetical protein SLV14_001822 [Streptomyces sp. Je 1-4]|uniref:hypothetical protein n=1 Tax=Streptomyces TaxID=1883 RepID=UPI001C8308FA|nr:MULTISPECIES: hypothetical protein [unclassified Streptomyces]UYB39337.1 hypothetical protein SLV14_001822 [Streptomyces sp. Je 1-4]UZQ35363.1 hypothetical protein SLV14N_001822 [Streptomyces sp. Je 1-4] [Streptomyces sp. Je 1-4 4N24]UZQ42781.1 hypothetical protein SLV14NA_001822 [Streptomyces sp. Je 1-4] [Streptomyces sp. Je 1-4 4N24_ara]